jgi:hypothetical protein
MTQHNEYALIGMKALRRAAEKVAADAIKHHYKIPVWNNGRIEYKVPGIATEQGAPADRGPVGRAD